MDSIAPTSDAHRSTRGWLVRARHSDTAELCSLVDVAQRILDGHLSNDDEISTGDGRWTRMSDVFEPQGLGVALRALGHVPFRS